MYQACEEVVVKAEAYLHCKNWRSELNLAVQQALLQFLTVRLTSRILNPYSMGVQCTHRLSKVCACANLCTLAGPWGAQSTIPATLVSSSSSACLNNDKNAVKIVHCLCARLLDGDRYFCHILISTGVFNAYVFFFLNGKSHSLHG